ncbi:DUF4223 family protein [Pseudomonas fluorescens]|uniref:DUF4223 family protein n=1 Tax=Pseudomonas fluorescens TaxID=294 RepID=UPI0012415546|nr:DUF4223 family protein [Pseudomonas fluorescens]
MENILKVSITVAAISSSVLVSGCTGQVYNQPKNCSYDYLFHPSVSISKAFDGCGPVNTLPQQK